MTNKEMLGQSPWWWRTNADRITQVAATLIGSVPWDDNIVNPEDAVLVAAQVVLEITERGNEPPGVPDYEHVREHLRSHLE